MRGSGRYQRQIDECLGGLVDKGWKRMIEFKKTEKKFAYWLWYTILFVILSFLIFLPFVLRGNGFIRDGDGYNQTYSVLIYIGKYLREWMTSGFQVKDFDFSLGLGEGVISALSWLGFGDIFTVLSAFVSPEYTEQLFNCIVLLKMYASGVTFSLYCFYHKLDRRYVLSGVFIYVFSRFSLVTGLEFYQNLNPVVWLPLLLLGIDKILDGKRSSCPLFVVTVFIQALNGFYYLYMETVFCVIYFLAVYFIRKREKSWKLFIEKGIQCGLHYLLGIMMAGMAFLPALTGYFNSSRTGRSEMHLKELFLYSGERYIQFLEYLFIPRAWTDCLVLPILVIFCILVAAFRKKGDRCTLFLLILLTCAYFIPATGTVMNGFSYSIDRWSHAVYFFAALLVIQVLAEKVDWGKKELLLGTVLIMGTFVLQFCCSSKELSLYLRLFYYVGLMLLFLGIWYFIKRKYFPERTVRLLLAFSLYNIVLNGLIITGPVILGGDGYSAGFRENDGLYETIEASVANQSDGEDDFRRMDVYDTSYGASFVLGYYGTSQYFSITNEHIYDFYRQMEISPGIRSVSHILRGLNGRQALEALVSAEFYEDRVLDRNGNYTTVLRENENCLPFGFLYQSSMTEEEFEKLNVFQKMDALLQTVVVEGGTQIEQAAGLKYSSVEELIYGAEYFNMDKQGSYLHVHPGSEIQIYLPEREYADGEVYLKLSGLELLNDLTTDINTGNTDIQVRNRTSAYYIGTDDFLVKTAVPGDRKIKITFTEDCTLKLDSITVYWYPTGHIADWTNRLEKEPLKNLRVGTDCIDGNVDASQDSWLFLSVPYSEGWSAYIDGRKVEIEKANIGFMALPVKRGNHEVHLEFHAPGSRAGQIMAVSGWGIFCIMLIAGRNKRRNENARI